MAENLDREPLWVILAEQNYAIRFAPEGYVVDFKVFAACLSKGADDEDWAWGLYDGKQAFEFEQSDRAFWEIGGGLKWDGCINWETNPECMVHGCSPGHADEIAAIFATIYHVGKRYFDLLGDAVPPLPEGAFELRERQAA